MVVASHVSAIKLTRIAVETKELWSLVLASPLPGLDSARAADDKYFLLRVLGIYGTGLASDPVLVLEKQLGLPSAQIKKSRDALTQAGYLIERLTSPRKGKAEADSRTHLGAYIKGFQVNEARLRERLLEAPKTYREMSVPWHFGPLVEALMSAGKVRRQIGQKGGSTPGAPKEMDFRDLAPPTRLLLAVLLSLADEGGVVREVGEGKLERVTGMLPDRLKGQLRALTEFGLILATVSGVSSRHAYGQAAGAIFLNLGHPLFQGYDGDAHTLILGLDESRTEPCLEAQYLYWKAGEVLRAEEALKSSVGVKGREVFWVRPDQSGIQAAFHGEVQQHLDRMAAFEWQPSRHHAEPVGLHKVFQSTGPGQGLERYLQYRLEHYASGLLPYPEDQFEVWRDDPPEDWLGRIQNDILPLRVGQKALAQELRWPPNVKWDDQVKCAPWVDGLLGERRREAARAVFLRALDLAVAGKRVIAAVRDEYEIRLSQEARYVFLPVQVCKRTERVLYAIVMTGTVSAMPAVPFMAVRQKSPHLGYRRWMMTNGEEPFGRERRFTVSNFLDRKVRRQLGLEDHSST